MMGKKNKKLNTELKSTSDVVRGNSGVNPVVSSETLLCSALYALCIPDMPDMMLIKQNLSPQSYTRTF